MVPTLPQATAHHHSMTAFIETQFPIGRLSAEP
jgi:hypothetical protein